MDEFGHIPGFRRILAADIRFTQPDIFNDQVWELNDREGTPPALSLNTTYGLRARKMRLFPQFSFSNQAVLDPAGFHTYPLISFSASNFCELIFFPFPSIDVKYQVWVPTSQIVVGQITLGNTGERSAHIGIDWLLQLHPLSVGKQMQPASMGINLVLQGETSGLFPVFYLTGGPHESSSSFPGLGLNLNMVPGAIRQITWALASLDSSESSFFQTRQYSSRHLESEKVKIEMVEKRHLVAIKPVQGRQQSLFTRSQQRAGQLLMPPVKSMKHETFTLDRNPDLGHINKEVSLEIKPEWSGQTLFDTWFMGESLLPGRPETYKALIQNLLEAQNEDGFVDFRTSVTHQSSGILAPPILATMVHGLHSYLQEPGWLEGAYPALIQFLERWIPVGVVVPPIDWTHPLQTGFIGSRGLDLQNQLQTWERLKTSQNPYLPSLLYRETVGLLQIARIIGRGDEMEWLESTRDRLSQVVQGLWNSRTARFDYLSNLTGKVDQGKILFQFSRPGSHKPLRKITSPGRLSIRYDTPERMPSDFSIVLIGVSQAGPVHERLTATSFQWIGSSGTHVTPQVFTSLVAVEVENLRRGDLISIGQADLECADFTQFMPFWAGIPTREQAELFFAGFPLDYFLGLYGLSIITGGCDTIGQKLPYFLAAMVVEGLIQYGQYDLAQRCFESHFLGMTALEEPGNSRDEICSKGRLEHLVPTLLYLKLNGIEKLTSKEVVITHYNTRTEPIEMEFNQVKLVLKQDNTDIITRNGDTINLSTSQPQRVILE